MTSGERAGGREVGDGVVCRARATSRRHSDAHCSRASRDARDEKE
jgi:hypothetical protein